MVWINKRLVFKINVYICFMKCLNCDADLFQVKGKRGKIFCDSTCRSNYWQKSKRLEKEGLTPDEIVNRIKKLNKGKEVKNPEVEKQKKSGNSSKHKPDDPTEGSNSFYLKFGVFHYDDENFKR